MGGDGVDGPIWVVVAGGTVCEMGVGLVSGDATRVLMSFECKDNVTVGSTCA